MRARSLSLVEVVLAIVIVGLAVPPLMLQLATAARAQQMAVVQMNLAQLAAEQMGAVFADAADAARGYVYIAADHYPPESDAGGLTGYQRSTLVREVSPTDHTTPQSGSGIKRVRIEVRGPDEASLVIETFVTDVAG